MDNSRRKGAAPWHVTALVLLMFFGAFYALSTLAKPYCAVHTTAYSCRFDKPYTQQEWKDAYNAIGQEYPVR